MPQPWKHPDSGMYYLRLRVPVGLRPLLGYEFKRSLKTRSPAEAKARYAEALLAAQQAFARANEQTAGKELLTDRDVEQLASRWYRDEVAKMDAQGSYAAWLVHGETVELEEGATVVSVPLPQTLRQAVEEDHDFALPQRLTRTIEQSLRDNNIPQPLRESATWMKLQAAYRELAGVNYPHRRPR